MMMMIIIIIIIIMMMIMILMMVMMIAKSDNNFISPNLHPFAVGCNFRGSQFKHGQTWQPYFPLLGVSKCITCSCRVSNIANSLKFSVHLGCIGIWCHTSKTLSISLFNQYCVTHVVVRKVLNNFSPFLRMEGRIVGVPPAPEGNVQTLLKVLWERVAVSLAQVNTATCFMTKYRFLSSSACWLVKNVVLNSTTTFADLVKTKTNREFFCRTLKSL